jgi:hypothetical protein
MYVTVAVATGLSLSYSIYYVSIYSLLRQTIPVHDYQARDRHTAYGYSGYGRVALTFLMFLAFGFLFSYYSSSSFCITFMASRLYRANTKVKLCTFLTGGPNRGEKLV